MGLSFGDLDEGVQRSVFSAFSILCILLLASLNKWVHYILIGGSLLFVGYSAYYLFLKPKMVFRKRQKA